MLNTFRGKFTTFWVEFMTDSSCQALIITGTFLLILGHCVCGSSSRPPSSVLDCTICCTWNVSGWWMTWSDGSSCLISAGICCRITLLPSTVISCWTWPFGCNCSRRGMLGAAFDDFPLASSAESSFGCAFFLWLRQFEPLAKVFSHLFFEGNLWVWRICREISMFYHGQA